MHSNANSIRYRDAPSTLQGMREHWRTRRITQRRRSSLIDPDGGSAMMRIFPFASNPARRTKTKQHRPLSHSSLLLSLRLGGYTNGVDLDLRFVFRSLLRNPRNPTVGLFETKPTATVCASVVCFQNRPATSLSLGVMLWRELASTMRTAMRMDG